MRQMPHLTQRRWLRAARYCSGPYAEGLRALRAHQTQRRELPLHSHLRLRPHLCICMCYIEASPSFYFCFGVLTMHTHACKHACQLERIWASAPCPELHGEASRSGSLLKCYISRTLVLSVYGLCIPIPATASLCTVV